MAKVKTEPFDFKAAAARADERLGTVVASRYTIVEVTPGEYDNERDTYWPDKSTRVFTTGTLPEVKTWLDNHEPDSSRNYFEIYEEELRERVVRDWRLGKKVDTTSASVVL